MDWFCRVEDLQETKKFVEVDLPEMPDLDTWLSSIKGTAQGQTIYMSTGGGRSSDDGEDTEAPVETPMSASASASASTSAVPPQPVSATEGEIDNDDDDYVPSASLKESLEDSTDVVDRLVRVRKRPCV